MLYTVWVLIGISFPVIDGPIKWDVFPCAINQPCFFQTEKDCNVVRDKLIDQTLEYNKEYDQDKEFHGGCRPLDYVYPPKKPWYEK